MYQIALCDDDAIFADHLKGKIQKWFQKEKAECYIQIYMDGKELLLSDQPVQIYFLDICMPDFSGFDLVKIIHSRDPKLPVVFVSNREDAVFDSIQYYPLRFVRKAFLEKDLENALTAFMAHQRKKVETSVIHLIVKNRQIELPVAELLYMESQLHYLNFHSLSENYHIRGKISDYQQLLSEYPFAMPCRGVLVNLDMITSIHPNEIILKTGSRIPLTRTFKADFLHQYMCHQKETYHVISI